MAGEFCSERFILSGHLFIWLFHIQVQAADRMIRQPGRRELIESGKFKSITDRCHPLEQAAEAHRYVKTGFRSGNVVIAIE